MKANSPNLMADISHLDKDQRLATRSVTCHLWKAFADSTSSHLNECISKLTSSWPLRFAKVKLSPFEFFLLSPGLELKEHTKNTSRAKHCVSCAFYDILEQIACSRCHVTLSVCMYLMIGKGQIAQKDYIGAKIDLRVNISIY